MGNNLTKHLIDLYFTSKCKHDIIRIDSQLPGSYRPISLAGLENILEMPIKGSQKIVSSENNSLHQVGSLL